MRVLFIKELQGVAKKGIIKDVNDGYAANFLIPKGYVRKANQQTMNELKSQVEKPSKIKIIKKTKKTKK